MLQATRRQWAQTNTTPGRLIRPLFGFLERLFRSDREPVDELPPEVRKDLGLRGDRPSRNRTEAYFSNPRRHGDWLRSGPL